MKADGFANGVIRNSSVVMTRTNTATGESFAVVGKNVTLEDVYAEATVTDAAATGGAYALAGDLDRAGVCTMNSRGGSLVATHANGSATAKEIDAQVSGSNVVMLGTKATAANWLGTSNIRHVDSDVSAAATSTSGLTYTTPGKVDASADVSLSPENIDDIASGIADALPVSAANVDKDHTWKFDSPSQVTAPNIVNEVIGFVGLVQMDFDEPMPARSSIASITSAAFANDAGTEPTVTSSAMSTDKKKVLVLIDASVATAGTYTISVKVVTTDSQTFVRKGRIMLT